MIQTTVERATYSPEQVAKLLSCSRQHCYQLLEAGEIPHARKIGGRWHIAIEPFDRWLAGGAQ